MSSRPRWSVGEAMQLITLYRRSRGHPTDDDVWRLRETLLSQTESRFRDDPSYRSVRSIRAQLSWLRLIDTESPRARDAPAAFHEAWSQWSTEPFSQQPEGETHDGAANDRKELVRILIELRVTLRELVSSNEYLPHNLQRSYEVAWANLEEVDQIGLAITALNSPAVDEHLAAHGLLGPQRIAKTESVDEAIQQRRTRGGWGPLKALLGYLDSILGSLTEVFPWLGAIKEFKEITEASVELGNEVPNIASE